MSDYYSRDEIVKGDFLFVSYRHEDREIVFGIVDLLISMGVRIWCDVDLKPGEQWDERVRAIIEHPKCLGAIFFNSTSAFLSAPIAQERFIAHAKRKRLGEDGISFFVLPVNIGRPSTVRLLKSTLESLPDDDSEIDSKFPLERINDIVDLFNRKTLYVYADGTNAQHCAETILSGIESFVPTVVDVSKVKLKGLGESVARKSGNIPCITFGRYKSTESTALPPYLLARDGIEEYNGEKYIIEAGKAYATAPIEWLCIYCDGDKAYLVSEKILEMRFGGDDLRKWLTTVFLESAFDSTERSCMIDKPLLVREQDIARADSKEFLKAAANERFSEKQWWIDAFSMGIMQKVIREDGSLYSHGYNSRIKKCGVRPMITVDMKELVRITNQGSK